MSEKNEKNNGIIDIFGTETPSADDVFMLATAEGYRKTQNGELACDALEAFGENVGDAIASLREALAELDFSHSENEDVGLYIDGVGLGLQRVIEDLHVAIGNAVTKRRHIEDLMKNQREYEKAQKAQKAEKAEDVDTAKGDSFIYGDIRDGFAIKP